jgi:hypothetical protein
MKNLDETNAELNAIMTAARAVDGLRHNELLSVKAAAFLAELEESYNKIEALKPEPEAKGYEPTKHELLAKYLDRGVTEFVQFDCFLNSTDDYVCAPDKDGDALTMQTTFELMHGAEIRLFIKPNVNKADALRGIFKISDFINNKYGSDARDLDNVPF